MHIPDFKKLKKIGYIPSHIFHELQNIEKLDKLRRATVHFNWKNIFIFLFGTVISVIFTLWLKNIGLPQETAYMGGFFLIAIILWASEALPLFLFFCSLYI